MKSVLISIQPKWCELIASGKKTVEVRKTKPKLETPFKCYIYCTKDNTFAEKTLRGFDDNGKAIYYKANKGKVIGEFVCDRVIGTCPWRLKGETGLCAKRTEEETNFPNNACLTLEEIENYAGSRGRGIYGWHITDLVVYDEPRELRDFKPYNRTEEDCKFSHLGLAIPKCKDCRECYVKRPYQSWGYVEATEPRQTAE
jgi:predicted transcriptional regulator